MARHAKGDGGSHEGDPSTTQYLPLPSAVGMPSAGGLSHDDSPVTLLCQKPFSAACVRKGAGYRRQTSLAAATPQPRAFHPMIAGRSQVLSLVACVAGGGGLAVPAPRLFAAGRAVLKKKVRPGWSALSSAVHAYGAGRSHTEAPVAGSTCDTARVRTTLRNATARLVDGYDLPAAARGKRGPVPARVASEARATACVQARTQYTWPSGLVKPFMAASGSVALTSEVTSLYLRGGC